MKKIFPVNQGFSVANIYRMIAFYQSYRNIRTAVRELQKLPIFMIPWSYNDMIILEMVE